MGGGIVLIFAEDSNPNGFSRLLTNGSVAYKEHIEI
jgi:hypothetical protein